MSRIILLLVCLFCSQSCLATSCVVSDDIVLEYSSKYRNKIDIESSDSDQKIYLTVSMPQEIEGMEFSAAYLIKKSDAGLEFTIPLGTIKEDSKIKTWYQMSSSMAKGTSIAIDYGSDCGITLRYQLR